MCDPELGEFHTKECQVLGIWNLWIQKEMSKSIHDQVMSPSACRTSGTVGVIPHSDPPAQPESWHRGNLTARARLSPEPNPSQEQGSTKPALEDKVLSPTGRKEKRWKHKNF